MRKAVDLMLIGFILLAYLFPSALTHASTQYKITVAVTFPYLSHIIRIIGGERVKVISLIPPTANPHSYEPPTKELLSALSNVDLIFMTGPSHLAIEERIKDLEKSGIIKTEIVDYQTYERYGLKLLKNPRTGTINPHGYVFSLSGLKAIAIAAAKELSKIDPSGTSYYESRLNMYLELLNEELAACKVSNALNVVIISPVLQYVVNDLGLNISYILLPSVEVEPTQMDLAHLKEIMNSGRAIVVGSDVILSKDPKILQFLKSMNIRPVIIPVSKYAQSPELVSVTLSNLVTSKAEENAPIPQPTGSIGLKSSLLLAGLIVEAGVIAALFVLLFKWRKAVIEALCKSYEAGEGSE